MNQLIQELGDKIGTLKADDAHDLAQYLRDNYHIRAPEIAEFSPEPEPIAVTVATERDVVLIDHGSDKLNVIRAVRELTKMSVMESKRLVESAPVALARDVNVTEADELKSQFESLGAVIELQ